MYTVYTYTHRIHGTICIFTYIWLTFCGKCREVYFTWILWDIHINIYIITCTFHETPGGHLEGFPSHNLSSSLNPNTPTPRNIIHIQTQYFEVCLHIWRANPNENPTKQKTSKNNSLFVKKWRNLPESLAEHQIVNFTAIVNLPPPNGPNVHPPRFIRGLIFAGVPYFSGNQWVFISWSTNPPNVTP